MDVLRRRRLAPWIGLPSLIFATVVFVCGWLPVSPFATWPDIALIGPAVPAVVPFAVLVRTLIGRTRRRWNAEPWEHSSLPSPIKWRALLGRRSAVILGVVAGSVLLSFLLRFLTYRGQGQIIDGQYVLTDHGKVLETVSRRDWLGVRTDESRVMTGHFVIFGLAGQLGLRARPPVPPPSPRPLAPTRDRPGRPRASHGPRTHDRPTPE